LFKADINIYVYRDYLKRLHYKRQAIEDYRKFLEQLVAMKKQDEENKKELQMMRDKLEEIRLKYDKQQRILEEERKEKKLNQQQFEEEYAKLAREKQALKDEYEAKLKHQAEQKASSLKEFEKLAALSQKREILAMHNKKTRQVIEHKYEEKLKLLKDDLRRNLISQQQFEEQEAEIKSWRLDSIKSKDEKYEKLEKRLESMELKELAELFEPTLVEVLKETATSFAKCAVKSVGNAMEACVGDPYSWINLVKWALNM